MGGRFKTFVFLNNYMAGVEKLEKDVGADDVWRNIRREAFPEDLYKGRDFIPGVGMLTSGYRYGKELLSEVSSSEKTGIIAMARLAQFATIVLFNGTIYVAGRNIYEYLRNF